MAMVVLSLIGAQESTDRGQARHASVTPLAEVRVPSPGSWAPGAQIERVVHAFDLPGTDNVLLLCAGSGNSTQWAAQRKYVCYRYNRNTSQYSTFNTPTDWFCNAAIHLSNGNLLIVGGTAIDGYPSTNNGQVGRSDRDLHLCTGVGPGDAPRQCDTRVVSGPARRPIWWHLQAWGVHNGAATDVWEYLPQGGTTWTRKTWAWRTRTYSDVRLIGTNLAAYTGATSAPSPNRPPSLC